MRLVSCYVAGFGQIKDFSYDFTDGLNTIFHENGWGKTTFSAFLKAMFYGLEHSSRAKKQLLDRKHYSPWDGTKCGGNLTFTVGNKTYRVERFFGKSDKDDTFALYDAITGLESGDFSENLGEEIFEVDRESFEKSIFVGQGIISTEMTDSLNAKMGNLSASKDDINNFDAAIARLSDAQKDYTRSSKVNTGKINLLRDEINKCSETIDKKPAVLDGYQKLLEKIDTEKRRQNWLEAEKERTSELIRIQSKREQERGAYQQKMADFAALQEEFAQLEAFFAKGLPTEDEQLQMEDLERQMDINRRMKQELVEKIPPQFTIDKWEKLFSEKKPDQQTLEEWRVKTTRVQELVLQEKHAKLSEESQQHYKELQIFFSRKLPTEMEISQMEELTEELTALEAKISNQEDVYNNQKNKIEFEERQGNQSQNILFLLMPLFVGLVMLGAGYAFYALGLNGIIRTISAIVCIFVGLLCCIAGVSSFIRRKSSFSKRMQDLSSDLEEQWSALEEMRLTKSDLRKTVNAFLGNFMLNPTHSTHMMVFDIRKNLEMYLHLQEQDNQSQSQTAEAIDELTGLRVELNIVLETYARVYGMNLYADSCEVELLDRLEKDIKFYENYIYDKNQLSMLQLTMDRQSELLDGYLGRFFGARYVLSHPEAKPVELLKQIHTKRDNYLVQQEKVARRQAELDEFSAVNSDDAPDVSIEEVQQQQASIEEEMSKIQETILQDRDTLSDTLALLDDIEDAENRLEELNEKRALYERQHDLLVRTEKALRQAKEQFLARYMAPLQKAMSRYLGLMDVDNTGNIPVADFEITMDLSVRVVSHGETYKAEYLSRGYQDLVALCARFALTDVLYHSEQPVMVLDDPFTNLDADKTACGLQLLQAVAQNRQILYFTCHESRTP